MGSPTDRSERGRLSILRACFKRIGESTANFVYVCHLVQQTGQVTLTDSKDARAIGQFGENIPEAKDGVSVRINNCFLACSCGSHKS